MPFHGKRFAKSYLGNSQSNYFSNIEQQFTTMSDLVTLSIDGIELAVPKGTLVVDAAKRIGKDIPVFCYHPKMKPVGMCRMCLVDVGMPVRDRQSGELVLGEDGNPEIRFAPVLQTGCTVEVAPGMVVRTNTDKVTNARGDIIEFLLINNSTPTCKKVQKTLWKVYTK